MSGRDRTGVPLPAATANNAGAGGLGEELPAPVLTRTQQRILTMIREYARLRGYPPSMREIGEATGLTSASSVAHQIGVLERKGYIRRDQRRPRAYVVLDPDGAP